MIISKQFKQNFINSFNFPIQIIDDPYFVYQLKLQENYNNAFSKWTELLTLIENHFNGNGELFLEEYRKFRDIIITDILNKDSLAGHYMLLLFQKETLRLFL